MRMMIVEDNEKMRAMMRHMLEHNLRRLEAIEECADGQDAVSRYAAFQPDWVLMDIQMEPLDGLTAARQIRSSHPQARIIIVTNFDYKEYREAAEEAGAYAFILKENLWEIPKMIRRATSS